MAMAVATRSMKRIKAIVTTSQVLGEVEIMMTMMRITEAGTREGLSAADLRGAEGRLKAEVKAEARDPSEIEGPAGGLGTAVEVVGLPEVTPQVQAAGPLHLQQMVAIFSLC